MRLTPLDQGPAMYGRGKPSARANFMQSVGGDELNVTVRAWLRFLSARCHPWLLWVLLLFVRWSAGTCRQIALSKLGRATEWVSVVPSGYLGAAVMC